MFDLGSDRYCGGAAAEVGVLSGLGKRLSIVVSIETEVDNFQNELFKELLCHGTHGY